MDNTNNKCKEIDFQLVKSMMGGVACEYTAGKSVFTNL
jgi:hypothetical protein